jgi:DNA-binding Lrp family transcriptional regulator
MITIKHTEILNFFCLQMQNLIRKYGTSFFVAIDLAATDIAVLKELLKDGGKSFRQISKETGISAPTVKTKFNRLVNMGIIKSISAMVDLNKLAYLKKDRNEDGRQLYTLIDHKTQKQLAKNKKDLQTAKRMITYLRCDYCKTPLLGRIYALKFSSLERFFCCIECRSAYKRKYAGRIDAIAKKDIKINC